METNESAPPASTQNKNTSNSQKYNPFDLFSVPDDNTNNNNYINNIQFNKYKVTMRLNYVELKSLKKKYLLELIRFINDSCYLSLKDEKFINSTYSIFKIIKNVFSDGYDIIIDKNANIKVFQDNMLDNNKNENNQNIFNEKEQMNSEKIKFKNCFKPPFYCPIHEKEFPDLDQYIFHNYSSHDYFLCEVCGQKFLNIKDFQNHINSNKNENSKDLKNNVYSKNNKEVDDKIQCKECHLKFDNIENMSSHYFECHEKIKMEEKKKKRKKKKSLKEKRNSKKKKKKKEKKN